MKTYPGLPEPTVDVVVDYEASRERYQNKAEFYIASLHLCGNTGTYVDSPRHRYRDGVDLAGLPLERLANLPVLVVDATQAGRAIGANAFRDLEMAGHAILVRTAGGPQCLGGRRNFPGPGLCGRRGVVKRLPSCSRKWGSARPRLRREGGNRPPSASGWGGKSDLHKPSIRRRGRSNRHTARISLPLVAVRRPDSAGPTTGEPQPDCQRWQSTRWRDPGRDSYQ